MGLFGRVRMSLRERHRSAGERAHAAARPGSNRLPGLPSPQAPNLDTELLGNPQYSAAVLQSLALLHCPTFWSPGFRPALLLCCSMRVCLIVIPPHFNTPRCRKVTLLTCEPV
jgi:hypothetical protein